MHIQFDRRKGPKNQNLPSAHRPGFVFIICWFLNRKHTNSCREFFIIDMFADKIIICLLPRLTSKEKHLFLAKLYSEKKSGKKFSQFFLLIQQLVFLGIKMFILSRVDFF